MRINRVNMLGGVAAALLGVVAVSGCNKQNQPEGPMERAGAAVDRAAKKTATAIDTAAEKTSETGSVVVDRTVDAAKAAAAATKDRRSA